MPDRTAAGEGRALSRRALFGFGGAMGLSLLASACTSTPDDRRSLAPTRSKTPPPRSGWFVVWEDDFTGDSLDDTVWTAADQGGNRDLGEQQDNLPAMVSIENGYLLLRAREQRSEGYPFVAGSISSKDKRTVGPYGRLTTRQLLGPGAGLGFGVCLYGQNIDEVGWPACGEIDATEVALARPTSPFASVHGPGYSGGSPISTVGQVPSLIDRWAEHMLEWEPGRLTWAIDGDVYAVAEASDPRASGGWPFDKPFFVTIVLTVGSGLSGPVDQNTWPRDAEGRPVEPYTAVDFVRFEQRSN